MTDPKQSSKPVVQGRLPKKKTQGTFDNLRQLPHPHPVEELLGLVPSLDGGFALEPPPTTSYHQEKTEVAPPTTTHHQIEAAPPPTTTQHELPPPSTTYHHPPPTTNSNRMMPIAPERDFARVPNSTIRDAIPGGLFKGTSKKLYDALYLRTRGAVVPIRKIRATQADLMDWARISHNTLRAHLRHLEQVGLLKKEWELGNNDGAVYEIVIPEELTRVLPPPSTTPYHLPPGSNQEMGGGTTQELVVGGGGYMPLESISYDQPKTSFKTNTTDDEAFRELNRILAEITEKLVGAKPNKSSREKWAEVGRLLVEEIEEVAARVESVSSVPGLLAAHLRGKRKLQLWRAEKARKGVQNDTVGAPSSAEEKPEGDKLLSQSEIDNFIPMYKDFIARGEYTLITLTEQFAASFSGQDWARILEQLQGKVPQKEVPDASA